MPPIGKIGQPTAKPRIQLEIDTKKNQKISSNLLPYNAYSAYPPDLTGQQ